MKKTLSLLILLVMTVSAAQAQCGIKNEAFKSGETLQYELFFNWKFVWMKVGSATWNVTQTNYNGKPAYRATLSTTTSKKADRYFIMRDKLTSYVDLNLSPLFYQKDANEGGTFRQEKVWYSYPSGQCALKMYYRRNQKTPQQKTYQSKNCAFDMMSMILRARCMDASNFKKGQRVPFLMAEGKRAEWRHVIYQGVKTFKMEGSNVTYRCRVFSYVEKEKGKDKEIVRFYITDDKNHLPVRLDLNLRFGTAKAYLTSVRGERNPQTSIVR